MLTADCSGNINANNLVVITATESKVQIQHDGSYSTGFFMDLFDYRDFKVGAEAVQCLTDNCYTLYTSAYSANGNQFNILKQHSEPAGSEPAFVDEINFILQGSQLKIVDGRGTCLLTKESNK